MTEEVLAQLPPRSASRPAIPWLGLARHIAPVTLVDFCYGWFLVGVSDLDSQLLRPELPSRSGQDGAVFHRGSAGRRHRRHGGRGPERRDSAPDRKSPCWRGAA